jgi:cell division protein FtsW (lipid II flippase)/cell division protein FtsI/penicillin-binding protein 2
MTRHVTANPVRRRWLRVDDTTRRAARIERFGLVVTSVVIAFGMWLTYSGQRFEIAAARADLASGRIVNLNTLTGSAELLPALGLFREPAERTAVADALFQRSVDPATPLEHVGGLSGVMLPAAKVRSDPRLVVLNDRLSVRGGDTVPALTPADITALKPAVVVRTPEQHRRRIIAAAALFMLAFWATHIVRALLGLTGDPILLPAVQLLTGLGLMTMVALRDPLRDTVAASTMAQGIAAACVIWVALSAVDFEVPRLRRAVLAPLAAAVVLASALLLFGGGPAGSGAKVNLLGIQPVEIIRPLFVFSLAAYFARRWQHLRELGAGVGSHARVRLTVPRWRDVRPLAISLGALLVFSVLQKDLGPALVLSCVFLGLFGVARARAGAVAGGLLALVGGLWAGYALGIPSTVTRRVAIWLDPWENALQGGDQIAHGLWALSIGGLSGLGAGVGDPQLIPAGHTDLVIAALGEELGFVGVATVAALLALLVWRMLRTALRAPGDYSAFLTVGLALAVVVQALVIIGGTLGVLPLTGVVTPFLSYGRSSMISNIAAVAVCAAVARRRGPVRPAFARPIRIVGWTLAVAGVMILGRAGFVQVVRADTLAARPNLTQQADGGFRYQYNPRLVAAGRTIPRGSIYDRNGLPLATGSAAEAEKFAAEYRRIGVTLPPGCQDGRTRCYPLGGIAFHVIGDATEQTNWAARNVSFVEQDFDSRLKGFDDHPEAVAITHRRSGRVHTVIRRDYSELLPLVRHQRNPSHPDVRRILERERNVRLALDAGLQVRVARAVRARTLAADSTAGAAVVLDPASGGLLASASYPWPEDIEHGSGAGGTFPPAQLLDRARYGLYPPGSTFKLVTAAAALRAAPTEQHGTFMCIRLPDGRVGGHVRGVGRPVRDDVSDHVPHGKVDLHRALVLSCNPYFAQLAQHVGAAALGETAAAAQIAAAPRPVLENLPRTLPHAGYGQGDVVASPLRMAGVAAALAGDGQLRATGVSIDPAERRPPAVRWVGEGAAALLRRYMREVVTSGTGRVLASHPVAIAGKTGTAEVDDAGSHSWFVGFAPYNGSRRKIAFAAIVENAGYGARSAAPLAGDIVTAARDAGLFR